MTNRMDLDLDGMGYQIFRPYRPYRDIGNRSKQPWGHAPSELWGCTSFPFPDQPGQIQSSNPNSLPKNLIIWVTGPKNSHQCLYQILTHTLRITLVYSINMYKHHVMSCPHLHLRANGAQTELQCSQLASSRLPKCWENRVISQSAAWKICHFQEVKSVKSCLYTKR